MNGDGIEQQLLAQPLRPPPRAWRDEILATARRHSRSGHAWWVDGFCVQVREWLWPSPLAWGGLAAGWVLIWALSLASATPQANGSAAVGFAGPWVVAPGVLAELLDTEPLPQPTPPPPGPPRPRSGRSGSSVVERHENAQMA